MNLTELATAYVESRRSLIWERSGDISGDIRGLFESIIAEINPLLDSHGAAIIDPQLADPTGILEPEVAP